MVTTIDMTGQRIGRWVVVKKKTKIVKRTAWLCRCDCGKERLIAGGALRGGLSLSCGCLNRMVAAYTLRTHGMTDHPVYKIWKDLRTRCENPKFKQFADYGGRGISTCERWKTFANFFADMGPSYRKGLSLERKNNDGNYEPDNCCWITRGMQSRNRRNSIFLDTPWGRLTIAETAKEVGISWFAMKARVDRKWPKEQIFLRNPNDRNSTHVRRLQRPRIRGKRTKMHQPLP